MQMLLVDTEAVIMHLINKAKASPAENLEYAYSRTSKEVSMRIHETFSERWTATLRIDEESERECIMGSVALRKNGCLKITGFFFRYRTPLLFEYVRDFCMKVGEGHDLSATQALLKEALPNLKLS